MPSTRPLPLGLLAGGRHERWDAPPPRYVALDVDGTLLLDERLPSPRILRAVERLVAADVHVGLATGRMAAASDELLATGVFSGPHVFHNGAVVADADGTERHVLGLTVADIDALLTFARHRDDLSVEVYVGRTYLADRDDVRSEPHARLLGARPSGLVTRATDLAGRAPVKAVVVCFTAAAARDTVAAIEGLGLAPGPAASPATPQLRYVNVTRAGVDKGSGVAAAAALVGIGLHAVAVLGDEVNDLPAFACVGTSIAMGGAASTLTDAAHLVAPRFEEEGAAVALEALAALAGLAPASATERTTTIEGQRAPGTW